MERSGGETAHLLSLAAAGNDDALGRVLAATSDRLLRLTRRMLRNYPRLRRWEQTDDVFQIAVLRLCRSLATVHPSDMQQFVGLAAVQIRRTLLDLARHHFGPQGSAAHHHSDGFRRSDGNSGHGVEAAMDGAEEPETLEAWTEFHEAVESLPADEKEAFSLTWYAALSQQDAASLLRISVPTLQRRLHRARHLLHQRLAH